MAPTRYLLTAFLITLSLITLAYPVEGGKRKEGRSGKGGKRNRLSELTTTTAPKLVCPPCSDINCTPRRESKLRCKGGIKRGICGCCPVCAKVEGESCGGEWNYLGECDINLQCKPDHPKYSLGPRNKQEARPASRYPEGRCKKMVTVDDDRNLPPIRVPQQDCKPKCTPDFCQRNPRALCSAVDVVDEKRSCMGDCQHTSCQACSWVTPEPDCGSCTQDDERCIQKYAKCVRRQYCTRQKFPCKAKASLKALKNYEQGKFQCLVPRCK